MKLNIRSKKFATLWLDLILITMTLSACTSKESYNSKLCYEFPKGGQAVAKVYRRLSKDDLAVMSEYSNRLYKTSQLPIFCK